MTVSPAISPPSEAVTAGAVVAAWAVTRRYGEADSAVDALRGVSMRVPPGEFTAVMGPSGSGKSTLMHILAGLDVPTTGQVWIGGEEITDMGDDELTLLRRRRIGFIFQFFNLLPMLTAEQNVVLPLSIAGEKPERDWVDEVIAQVGLSDRRTHRPSELSGGQQQRVAIARALAPEPSILIADEPTGNLDPSTSVGIMKLLDRINRTGTTVVMATHDDDIVDQMRKRVIELESGKVVRDQSRGVYGYSH
jgi:putative ABC transport system ATP-binding protein